MVLVVAGSLLAGGCATVASGEYARSVDEQGRPVARAHDEPRVSVGELTDLSSLHFGALEVTFENPSPDWIRITGVQLDFGSPEVNQAVVIPAGQDLQSWQDATSMRNAIAQTNRETALGLLALGSAVLGAVSDRGSAGAVVGALGVAGALTALTVSEVKGAVREAERVKLFPSTHLFGGPFGVPPGLFVKRWVVLHSQGVARQRCLRLAYLGYDTADGRRRRVLLNYGADATGSIWQRRACQEVALKEKTGNFPVR